MNVVGVDVSSFPIDEVLDFWRQNCDALQKYRRAVRLFAAEISALPTSRWQSQGRREGDSPARNAARLAPAEQEAPVRVVATYRQFAKRRAIHRQLSIFPIATPAV
jgi:hypothetical protein